MEMDMVTVTEVARRLRVSKQTALRVLREDGVPLYRVGVRKLAVRLTDLLRWLEQRQIQNQNQEG